MLRGTKHNAKAFTTSVEDSCQHHQTDNNVQHLAAALGAHTGT